MSTHTNISLDSISDSPKVSIVIPVYNTAAYIGEALESIRQQTLQNFEIIVINDGSTDQSLEIIQSAATSDSRIRVYTQTNLGVSAARNKGIEYVRGEFTYFLDSDDLLVTDALETCYQICKEENLDFVFFDAQNINPQNKYCSQSYIHKANQEKNVRKGIDILNDQLDTCTFRTPVWLNFIRTGYIKQYHFSFYPGIIHEDELFCFLLYVHATRVDYISRIFSRRRLREGSIMTQQFSRKNITGYFTVTDELLKFRKLQTAEIQKTIDKYLNSMLNAVIWRAHGLPFCDKCHILRQSFSKKYIRYIQLKNILALFLKR